MSKVVKSVLLGSLFLIFCGLNHLHAQQDHFVYIQSDDKLPFNVSVNGKTYSASSIGYVIVPKLNDGKYQLKISFPDNKFPEQEFNCVINKNDAGYALKNYGEKGWGLFNMQTLDITMAGAPAADAAKQTADPEAFGNMLSQVVDDSTLNKKEAIVVKETVPEKQTMNDSLIALQRETAVAPGDSSAIAQTPPDINIFKLAEESTNTGNNIVFVDKSSGDTIHVFLPVQIQDSAGSTVDSAITENKKDVADQNNSVVEKDSSASAATENKLPQIDSPAKNADSINISKTEEVKNPFFDSGQKKEEVSKNNDQQKDTALKEEAAKTDNPSSGTAGNYRSDCKSMINDADMDKIRKKMVSTDNDLKMGQVAQKYIQGKCVTTAQLKSLGALFLTDDGRYSFFNDIYKNVYDISVFPSLENQLIDPYYKKLFKAIAK